jgi:hypothetical protein
MGRIREQVGEKFIIGLAVSADHSVETTMHIGMLREIVAWHDERRLMDYVTCGTGSYFNFGEVMPTFQHPSTCVQVGIRADMTPA